MIQQSIKITFKEVLTMQEDRISKSLKEKISGLLTSAKGDGRLSNIDFVQNIS